MTADRLFALVDAEDGLKLGRARTRASRVLHQRVEKALAQVVRLVPDFRSSIVYSDVFTPKTIHRFTGHINGAVYGAPNKIKNGATHLENLFICGTDQGFVRQVRGTM